MRNYCKLFKGDISRKTNFFKCEEFTSIDALNNIQEDLNKIDLIKENKSINKRLLKKNNQWISKEDKDGAAEAEMLDLNPSNYRQMKMAETYQKTEDFFVLD